MPEPTVLKPDSIQIIETKDGAEGSKVIHYKGGSLMKDILTADDVRDLPILVYSVTGKTRGGKSFLLNLMYKYLDAEGNPEWTEGPIPNVFDIKDGTDSATRGLWLCTRIFRKTNNDGSKVGIMLMDNQGMFDGEVTGAESIAMSGVSTILSHVQMFNMKEKIITNDLEQIMLHLMPDSLEDTTNGHCNVGSCLMFVVRDFIGGEQYGYGLSNGRNYITDEQKRGTQEYQAMWEEQIRSFRNIQCMLMPHPGLEIMKNKFIQSPNLRVLESSFISEVSSFFIELFSPKNLNQQSGGLTGLKILETLEKLDGKPADKSLSYYQMYLELINRIAMEEAIGLFNSKLQSIEDLYMAKQTMEDILERVKFKGQAASGSSANLKSVLENIVNTKVVNHMVDNYKSEIDWTRLYTDLGLLMGSLEDIQRSKDSIMKEIGSRYYSKLADDESTKFKKFCETANSTEFYDKITVVKQPDSLNNFLEYTIAHCDNLHRTGACKVMLNNIRQHQKSEFMNTVKEAILRNIYKAKEYFVQRYRSQLKDNNLQSQNIILWEQLKNDIGEIGFLSECERIDFTKSIANEIVPFYYTSCRQEIHAQMQAEMSALSDDIFYERYKVYKDDNALSEIIVERFPEYNQFSSLGLTHTWENDKDLLKSNVKSYIDTRLNKWERGIERLAAQKLAEQKAQKAADKATKDATKKADEQAARQEALHAVQMATQEAAVQAAQHEVQIVKQQVVQQEVQHKAQIETLKAVITTAQQAAHQATHQAQQLAVQVTQLQAEKKKKSQWVRFRDSVTGDLLRNIGIAIGIATEKTIRSIAE